MKSTLKKPPAERHESELLELSSLLTKIKFFSEKKQITESDMKEIASQLKFE